MTESKGTDTMTETFEELKEERESNGNVFLLSKVKKVQVKWNKKDADRN